MLGTAHRSSSLVIHSTPQSGQRCSTNSFTGTLSLPRISAWLLELSLVVVFLACAHFGLAAFAPMPHGVAVIGSLPVFDPQDDHAGAAAQAM
jgi:hypothetical protein